MCGITGLIKRGDEPLDKEYFTRLLLETSSRGEHATGIAWLDNDFNLKILKDGLPASEFITLDQYKEIDFNNVQAVIGHCRYTTQGSEKKNFNNHPVFSKDMDIALIHNGIISNDTALFDQFKLTRDGQVDSEIILRLLEKGLSEHRGSIHKAMNNLNELTGSYAIACFHKRRLLLARHSNPLTMGYVEEKDWLVFASTGTIISNASCARHFTWKLGFFIQEHRKRVYTALTKDITDGSYMVINIGKTMKQLKEKEFYKEVPNKWGGYEENWYDYEQTESTADVKKPDEDRFLICESCYREDKEAGELRYFDKLDSILCKDCARQVNEVFEAGITEKEYDWKE